MEKINKDIEQKRAMTFANALREFLEGTKEIIEDVIKDPDLTEEEKEEFFDVVLPPVKNILSDVEKMGIEAKSESVENTDI